MNNAEHSFKVKGTVTKKFTIPMLIWEEWEEDCKSNFNNTYHLKMWYDHKYRQDMMEFINTVLYELNTLKDIVFELKSDLAEKDNTEKSENEKTFGGEK